MTQKELKQKLKAIGADTDEQKRQVCCALIGHSKIQTVCFGYYNCARCGAQLGDKLAGCYDDSDVVVVGHDCPTCHNNFDKLTWKDKFLCPADPFAKGTA